MAAINEIACLHGLAVIEDAAHAIEAWYGGRKAGRLGDAAVFSFYATKNLATGEGGMLVTDSDAIEEKVRVRSLHGLSRDAWKRYSAEGFKPYEVLYPGFKYNMMDLQASLGIHQLRRIESSLCVREAQWRTYASEFRGLDTLRIPPEDREVRHARHLFTIELNLAALRISRDRFVEALRAENVGAGVHFTPLHTHRFYRELFGDRRWHLPNAERIGERTVSLPLSPALTVDDVLSVATAVKRVCAYYRR
jgi:dTDP-4-amino-4,6-dideoxygalactose transaminase